MTCVTGSLGGTPGIGHRSSLPDRARPRDTRGMPRRALAALASLLLLASCRDWRERVDPALAAEEPEQEALAGAEEIVLEAKGHEIVLTPRARYRITGYAAEVSRKLLDEWDFAMPMDLALVWGPVADPAVLRRLDFHLSGRYVSYSYQGAAPAVALPTHIANNHLIPADDDVAALLDEVRIGDLVTLTGLLVDVEIRDRARSVFEARTSLRRGDTGSGACEILYVEDVERTRL